MCIQRISVFYRVMTRVLTVDQKASPFLSKQMEKKLVNLPLVKSPRRKKERAKLPMEKLYDTTSDTGP